MNFLIIKAESGYYNFYSKGNTYYVTHTNTRIIRTLNEEEVKSLLTYTFSSNMTYSHDENNYQIYIDEMDNKRYFKNGKEDLIKFIYNNGVSAINTSSKKGTTFTDISKMITLKVKKDIITMLLIASETAAMFTGSLVLKNEFMRYEPYSPVQTSELLDLMEKTSKLPEEEKEYFKNDRFIRDIVRFASSSRSEELREKLKDFGILYFTEEELNNPEYDNYLGYYDPINTKNKIHLRDSSPKTFYWAGAHEFVHLNQYQTQYRYILDPLAEIMAHEYFDRDPEYAYIEDIYNLNLLMEVIGPKPLLDCCYAGKEASLEDAIGEYLDENDKKELLKELRVTIELANKEKIRVYINKMIERKSELHPELEYLNKKLTGKERLHGKGYFFNQHAPEFYRKCKTEDQEYKEIREVDIDNIEELKYSTKEKITLDRIKKLYDTDEIKNYEYISIGYQKENGYIYYENVFSPNIENFELSLVYPPQDYEDFYRRYIENQEEINGFEITRKISLTDKNDINKELSNFGHDNHSKYVSIDHERCRRKVDMEDGKVIETFFEYRSYSMPSISELFPEQCFVDQSKERFTNLDLDEMFREVQTTETLQDDSFKK